MNPISRFPIRVIIPLLLLACGMLLGGLYLWLEVRASAAHVEAEAVEEAVYHGAHVSGTAEFLYANGHPELVESVVSRLGADPNLTLAYVADDAGRVLHSTSYKYKGLGYKAVPSAAKAGEIRTVQGSGASATGFSADRNTVYSVYTLLGAPDPGALRPERVYVFYAEYDLSFRKERAYAEALARSAKSAGALIVFATAVWLYFYRYLGARISVLTEATRRIAKGEGAGAGARLEGGDELAIISGAIDSMAGELVARERALKEVNEGLESKVAERTQELTLLNERLVDEVEERRSYAEDLCETNAELTALYRISTTIARSLDLDEMLEDALRTITGLKAFKASGVGVVFLLEGDRLRLAAQVGRTDEFVAAHEGLKVGDCICGQVAKGGAPIFTGDAMSDQRHTIKYPGMAAHAHVVMPLSAGQRVLGVLCLYMPAGAALEDRKMQMLTSVCSQLGVSISNARLYAETRRLSLHDSLTALPNRRYMELAFAGCMAKGRRQGAPFSVLIMDIDYFKRYNDTHGHSAGDRLLKEIAGILRSDLREMDLPVRYGGEEFLVILPDTNAVQAWDVAERIRKHMATTGVTVSIGVSTCLEGSGTVDDIVAKADAALYRAKQEGRNCSRQSG